MSNYNNKPTVWGNKPPMNQNNAMQPQLGGLGNLNHSAMVPFQQQQQVFQNMGLNQQNLGLGLQQMAATQLNASLASNPIFQQQLSAVSYPNPRGLNPTAFQTTSVNSNLQNNSGSGTKQRVFTGTVTQVHDNFGFIDDEVFFPRNSIVKGSNPTVGDRVLVEATFNSSMPFKWNATRVQVLLGNQPQSRDSRVGGRDHSSGYNAVPPPSDSGSGFGRRRDISRDRKPIVGERRPRSRDRDDDELDRKRRREERIREREKEDKDRKSPVRRRSRSPKARRRTRVVPRYMVQMPKIALDLPQADVLDIKRRYTNLYIPSDFFNTYIRWVDAFPPNKPYTLNKPCSFHIMYKELDSVNENDAILEPADADYRFSAKVMLMSVPNMEEIYQKCCAMAEDKDKRDRDSEDKDFVHPTRLVNFLVGLRGKNETMAIGGPWSSSMDGENPEKDPSVLIKTAIRTCKALTGIDLSNCTQWYRFVELYYRRSESTHKGKLVPARVETVVLFLPDVWSCLPTRIEWEDLQQSYRKHLEKILKAANGEEQDSDNGGGGGNDEKDDAAEEKLKPTHHAQLDPKSMMVADLRKELKARNSATSGLKSQLMARLNKLLKAEADNDDEQVEDKDVVAEVVEEVQEEKDKKSEPEEKKLDEQQKRRLEKQYTLPDQPHLIIHPSKTAKSGKFDCTSMSLSLLLDYRPEDTKEHSFEVSLFAELFNEMLMRDFGFNIFKALYQLPEKPKEKEEEKRKKDDKKDEKKGDDKKKDKKDDEKGEKSAEKDKKSDDGESKREKEEDDKKRDKDTKKDEKKSDSSDDDDDDEDRKDKKDKDRKKKDRVKLYTKNKHLLLSFVYFDQTQCGYIFDKDVEELLYTLGLNLSRSQVKKLLSKVIARDSLHYRKLTDKPKDEDKEKNENGENAAEKEDESKELAWGNKRLLPIFESEQTSSKHIRKGEEGSSTTFNDGLVVYQGAVVDIGKLLSQLDRSETARIATENLMVDLKSENHKVSEKYAKSSSTIKHLTSEMKDYKEKLRSTEDALGRSNAHAKLFHTTLIDIRDKIEPIVKTASHKDKEDRKDRDRDSDKKKDDKSRWEKDRDSSKKDSDKEVKKESDVKKEPDTKKEPKDRDKDEPKKEEVKKENGVEKKGAKSEKEEKDKNETGSQESEDEEMKEEEKN